MAARCSTSGSDHAIDIVYGRGIVNQHGSGECSPSNFTDHDSDVEAEGSNTRDLMAIFRKQLREILEGVSSSSSTAFELRLFLDAGKAVAIAKEKAGLNAPDDEEQKSSYRRFVMISLRSSGYNAAVCKTRWEQTTGQPAGDYEFIDVVIEGSRFKNERFFVDIDFRAQFEIARPTDEYNSLLQQLPTMFVGRAEKICGIIKIMSGAARKSLKDRGMSFPPWRKYRYMQAKWVGSYKRTTNPVGSRAAQSVFLQSPFSGSAPKVTGWDASVVHQMEKSNRADRNLMATSKSIKQSNEQLESRDRISTRGEQDRHVNKISGLARALAKANITPPSTSKGI